MAKSVNPDQTAPENDCDLDLDQTAENGKQCRH